ncbi:MAG: HEPN domain-containing protein [Opitutus sp.]|nr:HEPN domain-containing protein [Opitutus sp.]
MNAEVQAWVAKAEGDFRDVQRGLRARKHPHHDGVCFHAQQCLEKYLKARLVAAGASFPRTHDLGRLLDLTLLFEPWWETWRAELNLLSSYAVEFRYPGECATKEDARRAGRICRMLRERMRESLGLRTGRT